MHQTSLQDWLLLHSYGKTVLTQLQQQMQILVGNSRCPRLLQLGLPQINFLAEKTFTERYCVAPEDAPIVAQWQRLPFATESMDVVVLPFVLSQSADAHAILREAQRVLCGYGQLLIVDFNPHSLWRLKQQQVAQRLQCNFHHSLTPKRVADWCQLLDLQPECSRFINYAPFCDTSQKAHKWQWLELAGNRWWPHAAAMFAMQAVKQTVYLRPLQQASQRPVKEQTKHLKPVSIRKPEA